MSLPSSNDSFWNDVDPEGVLSDSYDDSDVVIISDEDANNGPENSDSDSDEDSDEDSGSASASASASASDSHSDFHSENSVQPLRVLAQPISLQRTLITSTSPAPQLPPTASPTQPAAQPALTATAHPATPPPYPRANLTSNPAPTPVPSTASPIIRRRKRPPSLNNPSHKSNPEADEANACPICLEPWAASGPHQLCCLPCGHLFGHSCIRQWLSDGRNGKRACPSCKHTSRYREVRLLFGLPTHLSAADVSASTLLRDQLAAEQAAHSATTRKLRAAKRELSAARHELRHAKRPGVREFGTRDARVARRLRSLLSVHTAGGTSTATFEPSGAMLYCERDGVGDRARVRRLCLSRGAPTTAMRAIPKRLTAITACHAIGRPDYRFVAAACGDRRVRVLSHDLIPAGEILVAAAPTSVMWGGGAYGLIAGLITGEVCAYDARRLNGGAIWRSYISEIGWRTVHSLAEVDGVLIAGAPAGVFAARIGSTSDGISFESALPDMGRSCAVSVSGRNIAVLTSENSTERGLRVFHGMNGTRVGKAVGESMSGMTHDMPFTSMGVVGGGEREECAVVCADHTQEAGVRAWAYGRNDDGGLGWGNVQVEKTEGGEQRGVRGCSALAIPRSARLDAVPTGTKSVFSAVSDSVVRIFGFGVH